MKESAIKNISPAVIIILLVSCLFFPVCTKKETVSPGNPSSLLHDVQRAGTFEELMECYAPGTREVVDSLRREGVLTGEQAFEMLRVVDEKSSWDIVSEKITGENACLVINFTGNRIENRIGQEMTLYLKRRDQRWFIDMEEDLRVIGSQRKKAVPEGYLQKRLRNYQ